MKYAYHDIRDIMKFHNLKKYNYMEPKSQMGGISVYEEQNWDTGLKESCILNLLDIPHFGCSREVNARVKQLLSCIHGRTLWLDEKVEIIV